jgi:hypothetical protein
MRFFLFIRRSIVTAAVSGLLAVSIAQHAAAAAGQEKKQQVPEAAAADINTERRALFESTAALTGIPWYYFAAIDQYERMIKKARPVGRPQPGGLTSISMTPAEWAGPLNPDQEDHSPRSIGWFHGIGRDGDGDGRADRANDADVLHTIATRLLKSGSSSDDIAIGLWDYYHNTRAVQRVMQYSRIYEAFNRIDLTEHAFPVPVKSNFSYRSTWGFRRSWGGARIHEGTDIFAGYGVPVRSSCYGIVEIKGWNKYGGWRVGIRGLDNVYYYYAHLSGYAKETQAGTVVKPGQTIGWVGSSGYGRPGTSGKFPPHLHYGLYRDVGLTEWSFDPYPYLKRWESEERKRLKKKK